MKDSVKNVLIIGGTGSIGQKLVHGFAEQGHKIVFQYKSNEQMAKYLCQNKNVVAWQADFLETTDFPEEDFNIVINAGGILLTKTLTHEVTNDEWLSTMTVNLTVPFLVIRKFLPSMMKKRWGRIINIGSIYSLRAVGKNSSYNVSKHGLSGLTKSVAKEYASFGITCNEICPSATESEIMNQLASRKEKEGIMSASEYLDIIRSDNPTGRMVFPNDILNAALFLASDAAAFINGQSIVVDGGQIC